MKTRWLAGIALSLAAGLQVVGCSDDDDASDAMTNDASAADSQSDANSPVDGGLEAAPISDSSVACEASDFCPTSLPGAPALNGIFAASATRAVAITKDGRILLWSGSVWSTLAQGYGSLIAIWGIDADHFLIAQDQSWSLIELTFSGADITLGTETLPFNSACAPAAMSISGRSATDLYAAGYCRIVDDSTFTVGYEGVLFRATPPAADAGAAAERSWSVVWSTGGPNLDAVALGAVYEVSPGVALAGGWRSNPETFPVPLTLKTTPPGTTTFVLSVKGSVVTKQDLAPNLAMCVQSIWATPTMDSVFLGGVCTAVDVSDINDTKTKYTTVAHRAALADGGAGAWAPVVREAYATLFDLPGTLLGFDTGEVYAAGAYLTQWDGTTFQLAPSALTGSPLGGRVQGLHGISSSDLWMVGDRFALHREQ